jgi:hypothetical protein
VTITRLLGKDTVRACLVNYMTTDEDIHTMVQEVQKVGSELMASFF